MRIFEGWHQKLLSFFKKKQSEGAAAEAARVAEEKSRARKLERRLWQSSAHHFYPLRPLFTLTIGLILIGLAVLIPGAMEVLIFLGVLVMVDDMVLYPWLHVLKYQVNIRHDFKRLRSIIGSVFIVASLITGLLVGYFVLAAHPDMLDFMHKIVTASDTSITALVASTIGFSLISKFFGYPQLLGIFIGAGVAKAIRVHLPLMLDITLMSGIILAFVGAILIKKLLQAGFWLYSKGKIGVGNTNAEGYDHLWWDIKSKKVLTQQKGIQEAVVELKLQSRARALGVGEKSYEALYTALVKGHAEVKKKCTWWHSVWGGQELMTGPLKDIYFLLMRVTRHPHTDQSNETQEDVIFLLICLQEMLKKDHPRNTISYYGFPLWEATKKFFREFCHFKQYRTELGIVVSNDACHRLRSIFILFLRGIESSLTKMKAESIEELKAAVEAYLEDYFRYSLPKENGAENSERKLELFFKRDARQWAEAYLDNHCCSKMKKELLSALEFWSHSTEKGFTFDRLAPLAENSEENNGPVEEEGDDLPFHKRLSHFALACLSEQQ